MGNKWDGIECKSCFIVSILQRSQLEISNLVRILRYCCAWISFNENTGFIIEDECASNHLSPWMFQFKLQVISLFIFNRIFMWCMSNNSTLNMWFICFPFKKIGHLMFLKSNKNIIKSPPAFIVQILYRSTGKHWNTMSWYVKWFLKYTFQGNFTMIRYITNVNIAFLSQWY